MLDKIRERRENEEGFTLIELMVVVLIIAILLAIAIPTFLGARERAQDRAAQSDIRNALTAEKVYYTDEEAYVNDAGGLITAIEPSLTYVAGPGTSDDVGLIVSGTGESVCVSKISESGTAFSLVDIATGADAGTYYDNVNCASPVLDTDPGGGYEKTGW